MTKRKRTDGVESNYCVPGCSIILCPEKVDELYANDKLYKYKIIHFNEKISILSCHALFNNICAFVLDIPTIESIYGPNSIASFSYLINFEEDNVKGKKKKTALKLKAGQPLCKITLKSKINVQENDDISEEISIICRVPINIQLLEINSDFCTQSELFWDSSYQRQYVAIAYPTFTLPDLEIAKSIMQQRSILHISSSSNVLHESNVILSSSISTTTLINQPENIYSDQILCDELDAFKNTKDNKLCFEFAKSGTCKHGDRCKFIH